MRIKSVLFFLCTLALACHDESRNAVRHERLTEPSDAVADTGVAVAPRPLTNRHKLRPVDEASSDPSFLAFRERLKKIVAEKDSRALLAAVDSNIRVSFGSDNGMEAFKNAWGSLGSNSALWDELRKVLHLGGAFRDSGDGRKVFWAPYTYASFPEEGVDAFSTLVVLDEHVPLKTNPQRSSATIGTLSHDIVNIAKGDDHEAAWRRVETSGGVTGYVESSQVRSHVDYRAAFEKKRGEWKLTAFVAGD